MLLHQDSNNHSSRTTDSVHQPEDGGSSISVVDKSVTIKPLYCCEESGVAFCGRDNGRVDICSLDSPENTMRNLYSHRGGSFTSVICIDWSCKSRIAVSADSSGRFRVMQVTRDAQREWGAELLVDDKVQSGCVIRQILIHPDGTFVLVSTPESDHLWSVASRKQVASMTGRGQSVRKWFIRASTPSHLLLFENNNVKVFDWSDLTPLTSVEVSLQSMGDEKKRDEETIIDFDAIHITSGGDDLMLVQKPHRSQQSLQGQSASVTTSATMTKICVFHLASMGPPASSSGGIPTSLSSLVSPFSQSNPYSQQQASGLHISAPFPFLTPPSSPPASVLFPMNILSARGRFPTRNAIHLPEVERIIGTVQRFHSWFLIFLSLCGWVCSVKLGDSDRQALDTYQKHFFVPSVWHTMNSSLITKVCRNQDIIFAHHGAVIAVKNGLDNGEHIPLL